MRNLHCISIAIILINSFASTLLAGPLNPPAGPVTSTHKTLSELEPRIAINSTNTPGDTDSLYKITQPGSYYFTGNILGISGKNGIKLALGPAGGHVSIDMKGFTLQGAAGSLSGLAWEGPDLDASKCLWQLIEGVVAKWDGYGIAGRGSGHISNVRVESAGLGCVSLTAGGNSTTTIENCSLRTTSGLALLNDGTAKCVIRRSTIEGDGCNTTSLCYHGGPVMTGDITLFVQNSTFSGPVIEVASTGSMTTEGGGRTSFVGVTAPSALHISAGSGATFVEDRTYDDDFMSCAFTIAIIDVARDSVQLHNLGIRADATTSAPACLRLTANHCVLGAIGEGASDTGFFVSAQSVPLAVDVIGSDNTISGGSMRTAGIGIRLTGGSNTVSTCRVSGTGAGSFTGVQILAGSTNNLITKNEFVNIGGGTAVSNLGGSTNGVSPIVTPGNLSAATNPFSNIQH